MKKILLILFVLIFNFSYSTINTEAEDIVIKKEFQEKVLRQSNSFSECFKTGLRDLEEMSFLMEEFIQKSEKIMNIKKDLSPEILKNERKRNELFDMIDEALAITEILESRLDHVYYFHASEIPSSTDADLILLKKRLLELNGLCRNYRDFINRYYD